MTEDRDLREGRVTTPDGIGLHYRAHGLGRSAATPVIVPNGIHLERDLGPLADTSPMVFYDLRGRGWSDPVTEPDRLGIRRDVEDLETVRAHLGLERVAVIGHSYLGLAVILYALDHLDRVERVVQIGASPPAAELQSQVSPPPPEVAAEWREVVTALQSGDDSEAVTRRFREVFLRLLVGDPERVSEVKMPPPEVANEHPGRVLATVGAVLAGLGGYDFREAVGKLRRPVLTIHGTVDRNAPFAGARAWVKALPEARLLPVPGAGHLPYVEDRDRVLAAIRTFLDGRWPEDAVARSTG